MNINDQIIEEVKNKAQEFFVGASGCHDWSHVERVCNLALKIAAKENADLNIIKLAAYLHDVGRKEEMDSKGQICHAEKGVELAEQILAPYQLDKEVVDNIKHCILTHRFRNDNQPETIEAKIIFDADKLDSIGAVGIARDFLFAGHSGSNCLYTGNEKKIIEAGKARDYSFSKEDSALLEYYFKLINVKDKILTQTGQEIAKERHDYMVEYFKRFEQEVEGLL